MPALAAHFNPSAHTYTPKLTVTGSGTRSWKLPNGKLHYAYGPALEFSNGDKDWWLHGRRLTKELFKQWQTLRGAAAENDAAAPFKIADLGSDMTAMWILPNGLIHRTDGFAIERTDGTREWLQQGKYHRTDGPAVAYADGIQQWWLRGHEVSEATFNRWRAKQEALQHAEYQAELSAELSVLTKGIGKPLPAAGKLALRAPSR